ncbi:Uncharacterized protein HZ326_28133 [Fusarium oxysporum f. sp. albedinis]|nr:Uncharacterized protein HZ326_28133 [Fusarium oxysporum f. sp. albedinis]
MRDAMHYRVPYSPILIICKENISVGTSYELVFNAGQLAFSGIKRRLKEARLDLGYETIGIIEASPLLERQYVKIPVILSSEFELIVSMIVQYLGT